jgi:hypothetical protein
MFHIFRAEYWQRNEPELISSTTQCTHVVFNSLRFAVCVCVCVCVRPISADDLSILLLEFSPLS